MASAVTVVGFFSSAADVWPIAAVDGVSLYLSGVVGFVEAEVLRVARGRFRSRDGDVV